MPGLGTNLAGAARQRAGHSLALLGAFAYGQKRAGHTPAVRKTQLTDLNFGGSAWCDKMFPPGGLILFFGTPEGGGDLPKWNMWSTGTSWWR